MNKKNLQVIFFCCRYLMHFFCFYRNCRFSFSIFCSVRLDWIKFQCVGLG